MQKFSKNLLLTLLVALVPFSISPWFESSRAFSSAPLSAAITQVGNGASTDSMDIPIWFNVSGGSSNTFNDCKSYFESSPDLRINIFANGEKYPFSGPISTWLPFISTTSVNPTTLSCFIDPAPFGFNPVWPFTNSSVSLEVSIVSGLSTLSTKTLTLYDSISAEPKIQIDTPSRGSNVSGDFDITFEAINPSSIYKLISTSFYRYPGLVSPCVGVSGRQLGPIGKTVERVSSQGGYFVTLLNDHDIHIKSLEKGNFTYCLFQTYQSNLHSDSTDTNITSINLNIDSPTPILSLDYKDPLFKSLDIPPYSISLSCPASITYSQPTYKCTVTATPSKTINLPFLNPSTNVTVTGVVPVELCIAKMYPLDGFCNYGPLDVSLDVPLGTSVPVNIKNFTGSSGYTSVDILSNPNAVGEKYYAWGSKNSAPKTSVKKPTSTVNIMNRLNAAGSLRWAADISTIPSRMTSYGFIGDYLTSGCGVWEFSSYANVLKASKDGIFPENPIIIGSDSKTKHGLAILSSRSTSTCALVVRKVAGF